MANHPTTKAARIAAVTARLFAALALLQIAAAVYWWWFYGFTVKLGPIEVRLHQWDKTWIIGMVFWLLAVVVRPGPFISEERLVRLFDPKRREQAPSPVRAWAVLGLGPGAALAYYFARLNEYLLPGVDYALAAALAAAAGSALLHGGGAWLVERLPRLSPERKASLRGGLYWFLILAGVRLLGPRWEGRFYDPLWPLLPGTVLGLALALSFGRPPRAGARGLIARWRPALLTLGIVMVIGVAGAVRGRLKSSSGRDVTRVIFITLDATRADHLSAYGYDRPTTPFIDSLARQGTRFDLAVCPMGTTDPSHVSMFTGAYPRTHGVIDVALPVTGPVMSLPEYFEERGFATAALVSRARLEPGAVLHLPGFDYENGPHRSRHYLEATAPNTFRRAANWLHRHRDQDVFVWAHFFDPHLPYFPHPGFPVRFTDATTPCDPVHWPDPGDYLSPEKVRRCRDLYDGEIAYTDHWVERLIDYVNHLKPRGKPPLIIILADHGEALGEYLHRDFHFSFGHEGLIHHAVAHIPLIMVGPSIPEGKVVKQVVETVDLAPTLVDYVFGAHDFQAQGRDLRPLMEGDGAGDDQAVIQRWKSDDYDWEIKPYPKEDRYGLYQGEWVLMVTPGRPPELYNLAADPLEERNRADDEPERTRRMEQAFQQWLARTPETAPARVDRDHEDALRTLGYINSAPSDNREQAPAPSGEE